MATSKEPNPSWGSVFFLINYLIHLAFFSAFFWSKKKKPKSDLYVVRLHRSIRFWTSLRDRASPGPRVSGAVRVSCPMQQRLASLAKPKPPCPSKGPRSFFEATEARFARHNEALPHLYLISISSLSHLYLISI